MLFSLSTDRKFNNVIKNTPENVGPGMYEVSPKFGNKKKMKAPFGCRSTGREIFPKPEDVPSPGEYDPKPLSANITVHSVFASESDRTVFRNPGTPGPCDYGTIDDWTPKKKTMRQRRSQLRTPPVVSGFVGQDVTGYTLEDGKWVPMKKRRTGPEWLGPGTYSPKLFSNDPVISMDRPSNRDLFQISDSPGPGAYHPVRKSDRLAVTIPTVPRTSIEPDGGSPTWVNPKQWATLTREGSPAFKSREKRDMFTPKENTPSPAAYHRERQARYTDGHAFGHMEERRFSMMHLNDHPGPGEYYPRGEKWIKGNNSQLSRSVDPRGTPNDWVPSPDSYQNPKQWGTGKSSKRPSSVFSSRTKRTLQKIEISPGPDSYSPMNLDSIRAIPPQIRETRYSTSGDWVNPSQAEVPSPDSYQHVEIRPGKGRTISRVSREDVDRDKFPGPGAYNVVHGSIMKKSLNRRAGGPRRQ